VVRQAKSRDINPRDPFHVLWRANRRLVLALLWAALVACVVGSLALDIAEWLSAWRAVSVDVLTGVAGLR
jgi:hypothetical protein